MLERVFLHVLNMSYIASFVIIFIVVVRSLLYKAPKKQLYIMWVVPLIRLTIPFSFESIWSLILVNPKPISQDILYSTNPEINTGIFSIDATIIGYLPKTTEIASVNPIQIWMFIGTCIWIVGILSFLTYGVISVLKLKDKLKNVGAEKDGIYYSASVRTPFVFGLIHPRIYLPISLSETEVNYIILHEKMHIQRFDHFTRFISYLVLCIHWFNPFVWFAFLLSGKDMEMSCDEAVIKHLGSDVKKNYAKTLLNLATGKRQFRITPLAFGEGDTKNRIKNILSFKSSKIYIIIGTVVLFIAAIGLLTNPKAKDSNLQNTIINQESASTTKNDDRETVAKNFLTNYYEVTPEVILKHTEFLTSNARENISPEDAQTLMNNYAASLSAEYSRWATPKEINRLLANRELDRLRQLAFDEGCTYEVKDIALASSVEKENYIIYDYIVSIATKNIGEVIHTTDITGKLRVDFENSEYLVAYFEVGRLDGLLSSNNSVSKDIGYITSVDDSGVINITFDPIEWITLDDLDKIKELELHTSDMPNGFFIHNAAIEALVFEVAEKAEYRFVDWNNEFSESVEDGFPYSTTNKNEFIKHLKSYKDESIYVPFWITIKDGIVQMIEEQYLP